MTRETANSLARAEVALREEAEELEPGPWQETLAYWARALDNALARYESQTGEPFPLPTIAKPRSSP